MLPSAGPALDGIVAQRLGDLAQAPNYSTDPAAADRLRARLEKSGILVLAEQSDGAWYCTLSVEMGWARERLATGSGETRELALCRAVFNLPPSVRRAVRDPAEPLSFEAGAQAATSAAAAQPQPAERAETTEPGSCAGCGAPLGRALSGLCPICSYRRGRQARVDFEARRRIRRRRSPATG
jgi:hypothetical protein